MAGLRVLGRALTTTPVLGFSVLLPPPRLSLSLINQPCSYATTRPLILPLPGPFLWPDHSGSGRPGGSFLYPCPGELPLDTTARNQVRASAPVRQEARSFLRPASLRPTLTLVPSLMSSRLSGATRSRLDASWSGDHALRASYSRRTGSHSRHRRRVRPRTATARPYG